MCARENKQHTKTSENNTLIVVIIFIFKQKHHQALRPAGWAAIGQYNTNRTSKDQGLQKVIGMGTARFPCVLV